MKSILVKSANGRAIGINLPEQMFPAGSPCPTFTGSGSFGLNVTLANSLGVLFPAAEPEMDEVLGLGSALNGTTTPADPWTESPPSARPTPPAGVSLRTPPLQTPAPAPRSLFSIDGGTTDPDDFNNCNNGGDYGDSLPMRRGKCRTHLSVAEVALPPWFVTIVSPELE